jgi:hypothetical protein
MKLTKVKFLYATLVALGIAVMPANAAVDGTWDANDVILGFRAASGTTGQGSTLLVNLGSAASYRDTTANINSIANLGSIIDSVYGTTAGSGSAWYERTDLWAGFISATNGTPSDNSGGVAIASQTTDYNSTIYVSTRRTNTGTVGSALSTRPGNSIPLDPQPAGGLIEVLRANTASKDGVTGDSNATAGIALIASGQTSSWNSYVSGSSSTDFSLYNIESAFTSGVRFASFGDVSNVEQAWDFYRVAKYAESDADSGKGIFQGTFTLDQNGGVDFIATSAAVPEPSTYMMSGLALAIGAYLFRRKNKKNNKQQSVA